MQYAKLDMTEELAKAARGEKTNTPVELLADWALGFVRVEVEAAQGDELPFLNALYELKDERGTL